MAIEAVDDRIRTDEMKSLSSSTRTERTPPAAIDANNPRPRVPVGAPLAVGIVKEAPFHPSPSLDERHITGLEHYEQFKSELQPAVSALSVATEALKAVDKAHLQLLKDGSKTDDQKLLVISGPAEKAHQRIYTHFATARETLENAATALEQQLQSPIQQKASNGGLNEEIRRHVKALPPAERLKFLEAALDEGDSDTVTAILGAPHYLTGITKVEHGYYLRKLHELRSPDAVKRLNATRAALAVLERTTPIALSSVEKAMRGTFKRATELRNVANGSQKALDEVLAAVNEHRAGAH
jgi:hypothetical protein